MKIIFIICTICITYIISLTLSKKKQKQETDLYKMRIITKSTKNMFINPWNGLRRHESFNLEKDCLQIINNNFNCICKKKCYHFPEIINYDNKRYKFFLSIRGLSLNNYHRFLNYNIIKKIVLNKHQIEEQVNCITHNLEKSKVAHLDLASKNICIDNEGTLSLIDFDIACINGRCISSKIQKKYNEYTTEKFKKKFIGSVSRILL
uniref:Protein kinase domain-containing protein n=1 Tax=Megaviridae environmental sample TaxID=1737588 RepID=A0A5J6VKH5_9VIRU|nr:MAG: hypothetical protein [Megaviridae environmental sample]